MARTAEFGIDGIRLRPGDHVCGLYFGWFDRDELMVPFFRTGLRAGDRCVVVTDRADPAPVLRKLGTDAETEEWLASGQLQVRTSPDEPRPSLHHHEMVEIFRRATAGATSAGPGLLRVGGEVSWWTPAASTAEIARYEHELNRHVTKEMVVLCLYDLSRFCPETVIDAVVTHPVLLIGDRIVDSPWYLPADDALDGCCDQRRPTMHDISAMVNHHG